MEKKVKERQRKEKKDGSVVWVLRNLGLKVDRISFFDADLFRRIHDGLFNNSPLLKSFVVSVCLDDGEDRVEGEGLVCLCSERKFKEIIEKAGKGNSRERKDLFLTERESKAFLKELFKLWMERDDEGRYIPLLFFAGKNFVNRLERDLGKRVGGIVLEKEVWEKIYSEVLKEVVKFIVEMRKRIEEDFRRASKVVVVKEERNGNFVVLPVVQEEKIQDVSEYFDMLKREFKKKGIDVTQGVLLAVYYDFVMKDLMFRDVLLRVVENPVALKSVSELVGKFFL